MLRSLAVLLLVLAAVGAAGAFLLVPGLRTREVAEVPANVQQYMRVDLAACEAFDTVYYEDSGMNDNLYEVAFSVEANPELCFQGTGYGDMTWSAGASDSTAAPAPTATDSSNVARFNASAHAPVDVADVDRTFAYKSTEGFGYIACDRVCRVGIWVYSL